MAKEKNKDPLSLSNLALGFAMIAIPALIAAFAGKGSSGDEKPEESAEEKTAEENEEGE